MVEPTTTLAADGRRWIVQSEPIGNEKARVRLICSRTGETRETRGHYRNCQAWLRQRLKVSLTAAQIRAAPPIAAPAKVEEPEVETAVAIAEPVAVGGSLNDHERTRLAHCEAVINRGLKTFVTVGLAIREINESRLYRDSHATFEAYVRERWDMSREQAYRQIRAAGLAATVRDAVDESVPEPVRETQMRPLARLDTPEQQAEAWVAAVERAEGAQPTEREVVAAVDEVKQKSGNTEKNTLEGASSSARAALHSSKSNDHGTPDAVLSAVRGLYGGVINLDPASSSAFNDRVGAEAFIELPRDGLQHDWFGRSFCNPPYGKTKGASNQGLWLAKAINEVDRGNCEAVAFLCNAHVGTKWFRDVWRYMCVFFDERLEFVDPSGVPATDPTHGNVLALIVRAPEAWEQAFIEAFGDLGTVCLPVREGVVEAVA